MDFVFNFFRGILGIIWSIIAVVSVICAIISIVQNEKLDSSKKMIWALVSIFVFPPIGPLAYFLVGRDG
ncbi:MAG: PLDc N-terminal domain-containing protein [Oscillospiraceae bacterium]|nr:PLDc N-terminal domain-containing protein [Oscillospiraceae bacterium]